MNRNSHFASPAKRKYTPDCLARNRLCIRSKGKDPIVPFRIFARTNKSSFAPFRSDFTDSFSATSYHRPELSRRSHSGVQWHFGRHIPSLVQRLSACREPNPPGPFSMITLQLCTLSIKTFSVTVNPGFEVHANPGQKKYPFLVRRRPDDMVDHPTPAESAQGSSQCVGS